MMSATIKLCDNSSGSIPSGKSLRSVRNTINQADTANRICKGGKCANGGQAIGVAENRQQKSWGALSMKPAYPIN
jgi:hypothetical protein